MLLYGTPPPSQRYRPIGFTLDGGGALISNDLLIRPEELTRTEPTRLAVQQTLGGAWADVFDRAVISIRLAGTTGWRGSGAVSGEAAFQQLYESSFNGWLTRRAAIVAGGGDPNVVELWFVDALDGTTDLVAPKSFTLRRSKSSPLLLRYVIELLVLQPSGSDPGSGATDPLAAALANPNGFAAGAGALGEVGDALGAAVPGLAGAFGA